MNYGMIAILAVAAAVGTVGWVAGAERKAAPQVLRHVVLFKFKDDAKPEQVKEVEEKFRALKSQISEIKDLEWGTNVSPENLNQGFTHCFFVTFADGKARDVYLTHAAHKEFVGVLKPVLDKVLVVDYAARD